MRILLIGSGGRESAMAWKMAHSNLVKEIIVLPGNAGMEILNTKIKTQSVSNFEDYLELKPDLVVIGPEKPLAEGLSDFFENHHIPVLGPSQKAANLETSKIFCKEIFTEASIPTAFYEVANNQNQAECILAKWKKDGVVVKVDALAQGKGVIVCQTVEEAKKACQGFFDGTYLGEKAKSLLLEERLSGPEVSAFALCDGHDFVYLGSATDYKRLLDHDHGPNTGGMGTLSPSPILSFEEEEWIKEKVFTMTMQVMKNRGLPFKGFLFAGLMKTSNGLMALEFNTRLGDPEAQSLLPRIDDDLAALFLKAAKGELKGESIKASPLTSIHVVLTAAGYPGVDGQKIRKGDPIHFEKFSSDTFFFPAGVGGASQKLVTQGGRVCGLTVIGPDLASIRVKVYDELKKIHFEGAQYRTDIGLKFL